MTTEWRMHIFPIIQYSATTAAGSCEKFTKLDFWIYLFTFYRIKDGDNKRLGLKEKGVYIYGAGVVCLGRPTFLQDNLITARLNNICSCVCSVNYVPLVDPYQGKVFKKKTHKQIYINV